MNQSELEKTKSRHFSFDSSFYTKIQSLLTPIGYSLENPRSLSEAVLKLSDHYIKNPKARTPWSEKWCQAAYLCYYFPLNWARSTAVVAEAKKLNFFKGLTEFIDFGSGLSAFSSLLLKSHFQSGICVEISTEAKALHKELSSTSQLTWQTNMGEIQSHQMGVFSYSLTELSQIPAWATKLEALMIVEPSTREDGRKLMQLRSDLQKKSFYLWAPCTHQKNCPLLINSQKDWCHDRIFFEAPDWFSEIEQHLPIKNSTISFSYLLARKTKPSETESSARITGDQLVERGKTRQLVCRGPEREFLSWLHKEGEPPQIPRGVRVKLEGPIEEKGQGERRCANVKVLD